MQSSIGTGGLSQLCQTDREINGALVETLWFKHKFLKLASDDGILLACAACERISVRLLNFPRAGFDSYQLFSSNKSDAIGVVYK